LTDAAVDETVGGAVAARGGRTAAVASALITFAEPAADPPGSDPARHRAPTSWCRLVPAVAAVLLVGGGIAAAPELGHLSGHLSGHPSGHPAAKATAHRPARHRPPHHVITVADLQRSG
jgi:hypothetical protein